MKEILFLDNPRNYHPNNAFVAYVSNVENKNQLLNELKIKLNFPDYFGYNWDALEECLKDFHWINEKQIVIIHDKISSLDKQTLEEYLEILYQAVQSWKQDEKHTFEIVFTKEMENLVLSILGK